VKTIPIALQAHYESGATTLATLWKITRTDGEVFGFTDHDAAITYDSVHYSPSSAFDASAVASRGDLSVSNLEVVGLLDSEGITAADIEAGRWDGAQIQVLQVNWADLSDGAEVIRVGETGQIQRKQGQYTAELRGLMAKLHNNIGRTIGPACDATLGDARCGVDLNALQVSGVVTAVTSRRAVTASALAQAAGYFTGGQITFTSGLNTGISMEVRDHDAGGVLVFALPLPFDVTVADAFDIKPGCDKTKATCIAKYSNLPNFRGFSFVPGQDKVLEVGGQ
jgi:uncharacterized phage protein (TIGR02218 family)